MTITGLVWFINFGVRIREQGNQMLLVYGEIPSTDLVCCYLCKDLGAFALMGSTFYILLRAFGLNDMVGITRCSL
uniref:Uncharacterized protein n=1 Tax=Nelumbo nucifera TaxID=4432 RepID=A0A822YZU4_NELNU|nr:TPA_asm: hypothetical protein HUJ06_007386 [Nelumbo nucifera]